MRKKKILLVDDEKIILKTLSRRLREEGFTVTTAGNKALALLRLKQFSYDIVITDLVIDGLGGIHILKEAKKIDPHISVIILTAYGDMASAIEALRAGADDYLLKPCDLDELLLRLSRCLERQYLRKEIEEYSRELEGTNKDLKAEIKERKKAEEEKRKALEDFDILYNSSKDAIVYTNLEGTFLYVNDAFTKLTGYSREELLNDKTFQELTPEEYHQSEAKLFEELLKANKPQEFEKEYIRKDGSRVPISLTAFVMKGSDKKQSRVGGIIRDITKRKRAEEKIQAETYLTQTLLDSMPCVALLIRPYEREIVACNEAALHAGAVVGKQCFATWGKSDEPCPWCLADEVWEMGEARQVEVEIEKTFWDTYWVPITKDLYLHYAFDITERKRAEEEIKLLAKYPEENPNPVLRIKNDGTVEFANQASGPILEAFKSTVGKCESRECLPDEWKKLIKEIYESQESKEVELEHQGRIFAITITPFTDTDYLYCYGRDITGQKQAEDELHKHRQHLQDLVQERTTELTNSNVQLKQEINVRKQTERKLRQRRKELQSLASELSLAEEKERRRIAVGLHDDIGQTLYISKMKLEDLRGSSSSAGLDKSLTELIENIEQTIQRTRSLTFELCSPILYELGFEAALRSLTEQVYEQHGIVFEFDDDGEHKLLDNKVHVLLYQSVRELLANVAKHAQATRVKVSAKREDNNIRIDVDDDGVGFDTIKINLPVDRDTGFGLFSIRERLAHLGGQLEIQSGQRSGTRVSLVVPLKNNYHVWKISK